MKKPTVADAVAGARLNVRKQGCNRQPNIKIVRLAPAVFYSEIQHDSWCAHPSMASERGRDA